MKKHTVADLRSMTFGKHDKPYRFFTSEQDMHGVKIDNWSHLSCVFVRWLIDKGLITIDNVPVPDHRGHGKDFINNKDSHEVQERGGAWKKVGPFYVDTKYNADDHIKNILSTLRYLGVTNPQFLISLRSE